MVKKSEILTYQTGDFTIQFPLLYIEGGQPGPVVTITAGVHGCEYPGILSAIQLYKKLEPAKIQGTIKIIPIVNLPAFETRTMFVCPIDGKNPNRCFPGRLDGTYTEVLVYHLFNKFIKNSDYHIDLHCGDMVENLLPIALMHQTGNENIDKSSKELAECFEVPIVITSTNLGFQDGGTSYAMASESGVPSIIAEVGGIGQVTVNDIEKIMKSLNNVLKYVACIEGVLEIDKKFPHFSHFVWVGAKKKGIFYRNCELGQEVSQGEIIGTIEDYLGNELEIIHAPISGKITIITTSPAVKEKGLLMALSGN
ncbi:M14 family metallopeptidase [uncultured Desulfosarcina sp.]|uniref:M14 family metallopeptidase n=1 Tax=uncultured Desulfosarcina sp. TaxID=218289 RepID=UPI0029C7236B|nr:M14 family metallopeptidase [uncultured Desulfosarcina sp.]